MFRHGPTLFLSPEPLAESVTAQGSGTRQPHGREPGDSLPAGGFWFRSETFTVRKSPLAPFLLWLTGSFPQGSFNCISFPFCRCERRARSPCGQWAWLAGGAMNVRWWKTGRSSAGTPAGEQTGPLPSIWQVSA